MPPTTSYKQVVPAGFYSLTFEHVTEGTPDVQLCTQGFGGAGYVLTQADMDDIFSAWATNLVANFSEHITFTKAYAKDAGGVVLETLGPSAGTAVAALGPVSNAVLVEKRTGVSGRRNRGRMYLPDVYEGEVDPNGHLNTPFVAGVQGHMDDFFDAMVAIDALADLVILHSKSWPFGTSEPADPGDAPAPTVMTGYAVGVVIGTQRRRIR